MYTSRCLILVAAICLSGCTSIASAWPVTADRLETLSPLSEGPAPIALPTEWDNPPPGGAVEASATGASGFATQTQTPTSLRTASTEPTLAPEPGLIIQGSVRSDSEDGPGLPGVSIYLSLSGEPQTLAATTNAQGEFRSGFIRLLNDETVTVRAVLAGHSMQPAEYQWHQVARGVETKTLDFNASPVTPYPPTVTPEPGLFIQGTVRTDSEGGLGLPGVSIYIGLSGPPAQRIAITDEQGEFRSGFIRLLNNETVTVRAVLADYGMQPAEYQWHQVARGVETKTLDFSASPVTPYPPTETLATPTLTPTSQPGPPELLSPPDGAVLPQPVPPNAWAFSWAARMGPCTAEIKIQGPGGRTLEASRTPAEGYAFRYVTTDLLPDDALSPWTWYVTVNCPLGRNQSQVRSFTVAPAATP